MTQPQSTITTDQKISPDALPSSEAKVLLDAFELPNSDDQVLDSAAHLVVAAPNVKLAPVDEPPTPIMEEHYSEPGYDVDLYVIKRPDRLIIEATLTDPDTGESVEFWDDGTTVWWEGTAGGEWVSGSVPATDFDSATDCYSGSQEGLFGLPSYTVLVWRAAIAVAICGVLDECGGSDGELDGGSGGYGESGDNGKAGEGDLGWAHI